MPSLKFDKTKLYCVEKHMKIKEANMNIDMVNIERVIDFLR